MSVTAVEVGCLLACACVSVCLGLDVSALGPSGVQSRCMCEGVCVVLRLRQYVLYTVYEYPDTEVCGGLCGFEIWIQ